MTSLRVTFLVFLVGASSLNLINVKERQDETGPPGVAPTAIPRALPTDKVDDPYGLNSMLNHSDVVAYKTAQASHKAALKEWNRGLSQLHDLVWIREAIIVTVAGVAWFLIRAKETGR
jgi:hypothetical protein